MPNYTLSHTGEQLDEAIARAIAFKTYNSLEENIFINGDFKVWQSPSSTSEDYPKTIQAGVITPTKICDLYAMVSDNTILVGKTNPASPGIYIQASGSWSSVLFCCVPQPRLNMLYTSDNYVLSYQLDGVVHYSTITSTELMNYKLSDSSAFIIPITLTGEGTQILDWVKLQVSQDGKYSAFIPNPYELELFICQKYRRWIPVYQTGYKRELVTSTNTFKDYYFVNADMQYLVDSDLTFSDDSVNKHLSVKSMLGPATLQAQNITLESISVLKNNVAGFIFSASGLPNTIVYPTFIEGSIWVDLTKFL